MKYILLVSLFVLGGCATSPDCTSCKIKKPVEACKTKDDCAIKKVCTDACDIKKSDCCK